MSDHSHLSGLPFPEHVYLKDIAPTDGSYEINVVDAETQEVLHTIFHQNEAAARISAEAFCRRSGWRLWEIAEFKAWFRAKLLEQLTIPRKPGTKVNAYVTAERRYDGTILATIDDMVLVELRKTASRTSLYVFDRIEINSPDQFAPLARRSRVMKPAKYVAYDALPMAWLEAVLRHHSEWIGHKGNNEFWPSAETTFINRTIPVDTKRVGALYVLRDLFDPNDTPVLARIKFPPVAAIPGQTSVTGPFRTEAAATWFHRKGYKYPPNMVDTIEKIERLAEVSRKHEEKRGVHNVRL